MNKYLDEFFDIFTYPEDARESLRDAYTCINSRQELLENFNSLLQCYADDMHCDYKSLLQSMTELSDKAGIHPYTGHLLLCICLSKTLRKYYKEAGIDESIWFSSMCDLKWKLIECKCVYGIDGSFVASWFSRFYDLTRFALGKLQFETVSFHGNYEKNGIRLTPESTVINVHIPRTGTRLDRESQLQAYKEAAEFFRERYQLEQIVFVCHSWLLFPRNKEVLSPQSNLYAFISDFEIIEQGEFEDYEEVWRLFDKNYEGDVDKLPQDSSFRRAYAEWIRTGQKTGWGYGVFVYPSAI